MSCGKQSAYPKTPECGYSGISYREYLIAQITPALVQYVHTAFDKHVGRILDGKAPESNVSYPQTIALHAVAIADAVIEHLDQESSR